MTPTTTDVRLDLELDFDQARIRWVEARREQRAKDTPRHRAAVADRRAEVDRVLDLYLELGGPPDG
jgi:hypothetical protein